MKYLTAVYTDAGSDHCINQDSVLLETAVTDHGHVLFSVICDGMGGFSKGEVASAMLANSCSVWFQTEFPKLLYRGLDEYAIRESWSKLVSESNQSIRSYGERLGIRLGTTLSALLMVRGNYYVLQVGDSRVYRMDGSLQQITEDQTYVQREIQKGHLTQKEAKEHPWRNVLLQCVGACSIVKPIFYTGEYQSGFWFLLCSDGFYREIRSEEFYVEMKQEFMNTEEEMQELLRKFTVQNRERGEEDNSSAVLIRVQ